MQRQNYNKTFIYIAVILTLLLMLLCYTFVFAYSVSAEELNNGAVLDFNQLQQYKLRETQYYETSISMIGNGIYKVSGYFTRWALNLAYSSTGYDIPIISGHRYYYVFNNSDTSINNNIGLSNNNQLVNNVYGKGEGIIKSNFTGNGAFRFLVDGTHTASNPYDFTAQPMIIDLTQMFGETKANSMTINDVKKYLPLDYYGYTLSSPITLGYAQAYAEGYSKAVETSRVTMSPFQVIQNMTPYNDGDKYTDSQILYNQTNYSTQALIYGMARIQLPYTMDKGSVLEINLNGGIYNNPGYIGTITGGSYFNKLYTLDGTYTNSPITFNITLPNTTDSIFIACYDGDVNSSNHTPSNFGLYDVTIAYSVTNFQGALIDSYNDGYFKGYSIAQNGSSMDNWGSSWDFIRSSFNGIGEILSLEIFPSVPLWTFIAIPLLFGLIAFIYKLSGNN